MCYIYLLYHSNLSGTGNVTATNPITRGMRYKESQESVFCGHQCDSKLEIFLSQESYETL